MILIADGGSTSCDWITFDENDRNSVQKINTKGINPSYTSAAAILDVMKSNKVLVDISKKVNAIYFFGAGCKNAKYTTLLSEVFSAFYPNVETVSIKSDIEGAVHACTQSPAVVAIIGTGSTVCVFDGKNIEMPFPSLGYSIMDDGSGSALGRMLLRSYFYGQMPYELKMPFQDSFILDTSFIKENLYNKEFPSRFLASYASFVFSHLDSEFVQNLLEENLRNFFVTHLSAFEKQLHSLPIHFVGSIGFLSKDIIKELCLEYGYTLGHLIKSPIDNLYLNFDSYKLK